MPKLPEPPPPGRLEASLGPTVKVLPRGARIWRLYYQGGDHPTAWNKFRYWGPGRNMRFDHHTDPPRSQERGVLYGASRVYTCFAEGFQATRTIECSRNEPFLVCYQLKRAVSLLDLTGTWPTKAGASMAINSGRRDRARDWSKRIYEDYEQVEGLYYPSSMDSNRPAVALYERAIGAIPKLPVFHHALTERGLRRVVLAACAIFGYALEP